MFELLSKLVNKVFSVAPSVRWLYLLYSVKSNDFYFHIEDENVRFEKSRITLQKVFQEIEHFKVQTKCDISEIKCFQRLSNVKSATDYSISFSGVTHQWGVTVCEGKYTTKKYYSKLLQAVEAIEKMSKIPEIRGVVCEPL